MSRSRSQDFLVQFGRRWRRQTAAVNCCWQLVTGGSPFPAVGSAVLMITSFHRSPSFVCVALGASLEISPLAGFLVRAFLSVSSEGAEGTPHVDARLAGDFARSARGRASETNETAPSTKAVAAGAPEGLPKPPSFKCRVFRGYLRSKQHTIRTHSFMVTV